MSFPRKLWFPNKEQREYHCFTDASGVGFGCAIYVKVEPQAAHLIFAKSLLKPARLPLTEATIPRLELQALNLGVKILNFLQKEVKFESKQATIWTDSSCNIERLNKYEKYDRFTMNRIIKIRGQYVIKHVPGEENPADLCSRGTTPDALRKSKFWWNGPSWLSQRKEDWANPRLEYIPGKEKLKMKK